MMEFLDIPIFDDDFYKMLFRFSINTLFLTIIIWFLYYKSSKKKDYLFTYYTISTIIFFLCFTLKKHELDVGIAIGLFAIFGIIRYRTVQIQVKEMTYLFVVIGVSVINSLANKKMSFVEIITANSIIVVTMMVFEKALFLRYEGQKEIIYEKIENIKPKNYQHLKADLEERTGLKIYKISVGSIDYLKDTALVTIYYDTKPQ